MSRTAVIVSDAEDSRALCRLCMIYHEYFVNIFIPNDAFRICAEEAIHDLLSLKVAVGDGLPSNICHQCVNKLMEFRDFKEMCLKTAAELRKYYMDNALRLINGLVKKASERKRRFHRTARILMRRRRMRRLAHQFLSGRGRERQRWLQPELNFLSSEEGYWELVVPFYSEERFRRKFRMGRDTFLTLVGVLSASIERKNTIMRQSIKVEKRVAIAIFCLKGYSDFWSVGDMFRVGASTVPSILYEVCDAINGEVFPFMVQFPRDNSRKEEIARGFWSLWQFPHTFGALDGTHIRILKPSEDPMDYWNYKGYHSMVLMALVDHEYKFMYANIGRPGRVNDATIFNFSGLRVELDRRHFDAKLHIIGDGGFPLSPTLLRPYVQTGNMTAIQVNFNSRLSRARVVVEDAFGRLKGRWRVLLKRLDLGVLNVQRVVKTCVALHNICEQQKEYFYPEWAPALNEGAPNLEQPNAAVREGGNVEGALKRDRLANHLFFDNVFLD